MEQDEIPFGSEYDLALNNLSFWNTHVETSDLRNWVAELGMIKRRLGDLGWSEKWIAKMIRYF